MPYKYKLSWSLLKSIPQLKTNVFERNVFGQVFIWHFLKMALDSWVSPWRRWALNTTFSFLPALFFMFRCFWILPCNSQHLFTLPHIGLCTANAKEWWPVFLDLLGFLQLWKPGQKVAVTVFYDVQDTDGRKGKLKRNKQSLRIFTTIKGSCLPRSNCEITVMGLPTFLRSWTPSMFVKPSPLESITIRLLGHMSTCTSQLSFSSPLRWSETESGSPDEVYFLNSLSCERFTLVI